MLTKLTKQGTAILVGALHVLTLLIKYYVFKNASCLRPVSAG